MGKHLEVEVLRLISYRQADYDDYLEGKPNGSLHLRVMPGQKGKREYTGTPYKGADTRPSFYLPTAKVGDRQVKLYERKSMAPVSNISITTPLGQDISSLGSMILRYATQYGLKIFDNYYPPKQDFPEKSFDEVFDEISSMITSEYNIKASDIHQRKSGYFSDLWFPVKVTQK